MPKDILKKIIEESFIFLLFLAIIISWFINIQPLTTIFILLFIIAFLTKINKKNIIKLALILLIISAFLLIFKQEKAATNITNWSYYLLFIFITTMFIEVFIKNPESIKIDFKNSLTATKEIIVNKSIWLNQATQIYSKKTKKTIIIAETIIIFFRAITIIFLTLVITNFIFSYLLHQLPPDSSGKTYLTEKRGRIKIKNVGELIGSVMVIQSVKIERNNWDGLNIVLANFGDNPKGEIILTIKEDLKDKDDIRVVKLNASSITKSYYYYKFTFKPIKDSKGKTYYIFFQTKNSEEGNTITIPYNNTNEYILGTMYFAKLPSSSETGQRFIDMAQKDDADLIFEIHYYTPILDIYKKYSNKIRI